MPKHGTKEGYYADCRCDECHKAHQIYTKTRREKTAETLRTLKDKPCHDCGNKFPPECMDFDHRQGTTKLANIAQLANRPRKILDDEIAKCDLVCANCHRTRTFRTGRKTGFNKRRFFGRKELHDDGHVVE